MCVMQNTITDAKAWIRGEVVSQEAYRTLTTPLTRRTRTSQTRVQRRRRRRVAKCRRRPEGN